MKINVMMMKQQAYDDLRKNIDIIYNKILENPDSGSWVRSFLGYEPYETTTYEIEDFQLKYSSNYNDVAVENGITLYEHLNNVLPAYILYNLNFWAWINFEKAYKQARQSVEIHSAKTILNSWLSDDNNRRGIMLGAMSREFIKIKMTVDELRPDKYELAKYLFSNKTLHIMLMARNISDIPNIAHAVIQIVKQIYETTGLQLTRDQDNDLLKLAYRMGSVMLVETLSVDEIVEYLIPRFSQLYPDLFQSN